MRLAWIAVGVVAAVYGGRALYSGLRPRTGRLVLRSCEGIDPATPVRSICVKTYPTLGRILDTLVFRPTHFLVPPIPRPDHWWAVLELGDDWPERKLVCVQVVWSGDMIVTGVADEAAADRCTAHRNFWGNHCLSGREVRVRRTIPAQPAAPTWGDFVAWAGRRNLAYRLFSRNCQNAIQDVYDWAAAKQGSAMPAIDLARCHAIAEPLLPSSPSKILLPTGLGESERVGQHGAGECARTPC